MEGDSHTYPPPACSHTEVDRAGEREKLESAAAESRNNLIKAAKEVRSEVK